MEEVDADKDGSSAPAGFTTLSCYPSSAPLRDPSSATHGDPRSPRFPDLTVAAPCLSPSPEALGTGNSPATHVPPRIFRLTNGASRQPISATTASHAPFLPGPVAGQPKPSSGSRRPTGAISIVFTVIELWEEDEGSIQTKLR
ncbi:hypothetical protein MLD38_005626 [Melastoma candidum]|uniref:Uncharacterized protein n=1 Tax=Melastoma candidum TaxID=119954 RepID=A0ACB9RKT2_9MYRT|nr:hypothetical protein MLD38_005626 [Melastoma candidum]